MRLKNHTAHEDIASVFINVNNDDNFDIVDIDFNVSDLEFQDYEGFMLDMIRVFKRYNIKIVSK